MGKVIEGNFEKKRAETADKKSKTLEETGTISESDWEKLAQILLVSGMGLPVESLKAVEKIKNLPVSPSTLEDQRAIVCEYVDAELQRRIKESSEIDWKRKPAFFRAIVDELEARLVNKLPKL